MRGYVRMDDRRNVFVIGLDDFNRRLLETVRGAERLRFHGLIPYGTIVNPDHYDIEEILHGAQRMLDEFDGRVDAIIGHWDFPATTLLPLLRAHVGLPGPTLEAVLCAARTSTGIVVSSVMRRRS